VSKKELVITSLDDPVQVYLNHLSTEKTKSRGSKKKPRLTPRNATEATRVAKESGLPRKILKDKATQTPHVSSVEELHSSRPRAIAGPMPDLHELLTQKKRSQT